ncbi:MAG: hypothetical protein FJ126_14245 [Deltaproteobacteria bacterium]|nr:hypothetical protein [Deltaproteobacteria bacterium]
MPFKTIFIEWDGPYSFDELEELYDESCDFGLYQVYGVHPVYGEETLLFLDRTTDWVFGARLASEQPYWDAEGDFHPLSIYVGRLAGEMTPGGEAWNREIEQAARLLIFAHAPVFNDRELGSPPDRDLKEVHVINWGAHMDLAPEVSGARWLYKFAELSDYNVYGKHGAVGD